MDVYSTKRNTVWDNPYSNTENNPYSNWTELIPVYLHRCASRCARFWLWCHGSSLQGSSGWVWSLFEIGMLLHWTKIPGCTSMRLEVALFESDESQKDNVNKLWRLDRHGLFTLSFWLSFYKTIKYLNSRNAYIKISHPLPIAHVKIGYTFHEPCPHELDSSTLFINSELYMPLTHWGRMSHNSGNILRHICFSWWLAACFAPSDYLH